MNGAEPADTPSILKRLLMGPELWVVGVLVSGRLEASIGPVGRIVDLTLLSLLAVGALLWLRTARDGLVVARRAALLGVLFVVFCAWALLTLAWTPSPVYGTSKAFQLVGVALPLLLVGVAHSARPASAGHVALVLAVAALVVSAVLMLEILRARSSESVGVLAESYLATGRILSLGAVAAAGMAFVATEVRWRVFSLLAAVVLLVMLLFLGGRGALLSAVLGISLCTVVATQTVVWRGKLARAAVAAVASVVLVAMAIGVADRFGLPLKTVSRLQVLLGGDPGSSANARVAHWRTAWTAVQASPLKGSGIGAYSRIAGVGDQRYYPHNIFLEVWVELGLPGLLLFMSVLVVGTAGAGLRFSRGFALPVVLRTGVVGAALAAALLSGDLSDNRALFAMLGLFANVNEADAE